MFDNEKRPLWIDLSIIFILLLSIGSFFIKDVDKVQAAYGNEAPTEVIHVSSTATTSERRIRWDGTSIEIWLQHKDPTNNLLISFDTGTTKRWWTLPDSTEDIYYFATSEFYLKSSAGSVAFEAMIFKRGN